MKNNKQKAVLKIDWATHKASKHACENWHYSKLKPSGSIVHFGVWENDKFIGVVLYGRGVAPNLLNPYGLKVNEGCELVRIALKQHITPVSRIVSITLKMLKKKFPGLRLVVSFADMNVDHHGGIYQAGNWVYSGFTSTTRAPIVNGKQIHSRTLNHSSKTKKQSMDIQWVSVKPKHRYLMPLDDEIKKQIQCLRKPYPKRAVSKDIVATGNHSVEDGENPITALQT